MILPPSAHIRTNWIMSSRSQDWDRKPIAACLAG